MGGRHFWLLKELADILGKPQAIIFRRPQLPRALVRGKSGAYICQRKRLHPGESRLIKFILSSGKTWSILISVRLSFYFT